MAKTYRRSDIKDEMIVRALVEYSNGGPLAWDVFVNEGIPGRVIVAAFERCYEHGYIECGVSIAYPWPTENGLALIGAESDTMARYFARLGGRSDD